MDENSYESLHRSLERGGIAAERYAFKFVITCVIVAVAVLLVLSCGVEIS